MNTEFNFTKRVLENLPIVEKRTRFRDYGSKQSVNGLQLTVTLAGSKTFYFRRKFNNKYVEVKLGNFPEMTVENGRKAAKEAAIAFDSGINPNEQKKELRDSILFNDLFEIYKKDFEIDIKNLKRRQTSLNAAEILWKLHLKSLVGNRHVMTFSQSDVKALTLKLKQDKSYAIYNHVVTLLKSMFNRAGLNENPFRDLKRIDEGVYVRERTLNRDELDRLFESMKQEPQIYQDVIMALLLTGQRKSNVLCMEWCEIDQENKTWTIPTSKIKTKKSHIVPISNELMAILERRSNEAEPNEAFVFPSKRSKTGHISEKTSKGAFWRRVIVRAGLYSEDRNKNVRIHDLRRTLATVQVSSGGSLQSTSKLLGHSDISITSNVYAHLALDSVRSELENTTAKLLGNSDPLIEIKRQVEKLTMEQKAELIEFLGVA